MPGRPEWLSPEHHTQQGPKHLTKLHDIGDMIHDGGKIKGRAFESDRQVTSPVTDAEITTFDVTDTGHLNVNNAPVPTPQEELLPSTQRQGMLFDPYTGTGLPRDPTVSKEQRLAAVDRQLDLRGVAAPQLRETYAMGDTPISEFDRPITRSPHGDRSGASKMKATEFYEGDDPQRLVADRPKIQQGRGMWGGGIYQTRTNTASVNKRYDQTVVDYPTRSMTRPTKDAVSTGTVWNPDWYSGSYKGSGKGLIPEGGKIEDEANHLAITEQILKRSIFHNPETGETLNPHTGTSATLEPGGTAPMLAAGEEMFRSDPYRHLGRFSPGAGYVNS